MVSEIRNRLRLPAKKLWYRKRYSKYLLNSNEQVDLRKIKKYLCSLLLLFASKNLSKEKKEKVKVAIFFLNLLHIKISKISDGEVLKKPKASVHETIDSFAESIWKLNFRFERKDMHRLFVLFKFPAVVTFDNRSKMFGEEVFCRGLYEFASGDNQEKICQNIFGRECSIQTRAFKFFYEPYIR